MPSAKTRKSFQGKGDISKWKCPPGKEWLYVGHYFDNKGRFILKIGTTNDLARRQKEHTRNYHKSPYNTLPENEVFCYDYAIPLSKYNTLRYEDSNRMLWKETNVGEFVRNDRFVCPCKPLEVKVKIRKEYIISL